METGDQKDEVSASNVRKDLTEWQEKHALLVLKSVPVRHAFSLLFE
jgi:hypothetical protein